MSALFTVAIAAAILWAAPAHAQTVFRAEMAPLGERFISLCKSPTNAGRDSCGGVVTALMNAHLEMARQNPDKRIICPPRILTIEEGRRVFLQWANITAAAPTMRFPHLVMEALISRYPCSQYKIRK
jgi:hypothetical protein